MFLRCKVRRKDGKQHRYWSVVENTRVAGGRVVQRHVLYLGEINDTQELAWRRSIEVLEDGAARPRTLSLFPEDRCEGLLADASIVGVRLSELRLRRPRQWGACWLALMLATWINPPSIKPKRFIDAASAPAERPQQNGASLIMATLVDASAKAQAAGGLAAREA